MGRHARERAVRVVFLILALGILLLARQIPVIGAVLIVVTVILGLGAMSLYVWRRRAAWTGGIRLAPSRGLCYEGSRSGRRLRTMVSEAAGRGDKGDASGI